ncbi:MAG: exonuclease domain-containing protein [Lachnospiraceae bacterium]|nr:exonuclease domain-containing protein [Lachnospiraceae bacterium]
MKHVVIDLEMNNTCKKPGERRKCSMETIEIGAVMLDDNLNEVSSFRTYVKPEFNDGVVKKITKLTGITTEMVENAPRFNEALRMFTSWCLGTDDEVTIYAWSQSDYAQVSKEMVVKGYELSYEEVVLFDTEWFDFQQEFDTNLGFERQLSLNFALEMAGVDFAGHRHNALDDARNTAELFRIFKDEELFEKTLRKIRDAMVPTPLGNTIGNMVDFSKFVSA